MTPPWQGNQTNKIYPTGLLKLGADVLLINFSLLTSLVIRLLWIIAFTPQVGDSYQKILWDYWYVYTDSAWLLSLICVVIFFLNGFYTDGRLYQGKYKHLIVIQAVGLAYLIFGALTFLSQGIFFDFLKKYLIVSRGALMVSWALSTIFLVAARMWISIWRQIGTLYGLSGRYRFDLVVNLLTAKALIDGEITIFGGNQWRSFVHVEDAARSIMHVLAAPLEVVRGQIFNVGSDEQNYSINCIGDMIQSYVASAQIINKGEEVDPNNFRVSFIKIRKILGFVPQWTVEKGIEQVRDAILSGRVVDYKLPEYSNIKFLTLEGITRLDRHENGWAARLLDELNGVMIEQV